MKHEWKKHEKEIYGVKEEPQIVNIPSQKFFKIKGVGNPNEEDFSERIGVLYALSYAVKMMPKKGYTPDGYFEYAIYPLEGAWEGKLTEDKKELRYTIMIRQPEFVTNEIADKAFEMARKKKIGPLLEEAYFEEVEGYTGVQILHNGDYDDEPRSFSLLKKYMEDNELVRSTEHHIEVYLLDGRKTPRDKLKTILRYQVEENKKNTP